MNTPGTKALIVSTALALVAVVATSATAHDLFLRPKNFLVRAGSTVDVRVLNGTFSTSESSVAPERLRDLTVLGPDSLSKPDRRGWTNTKNESAWRAKVGGPGTYVLGASLDPSAIRLDAKVFNGYLREEGLTDVIDARRAAGTLDAPAHERYSKHVKALVRVRGASPANEAADTVYRRALGYPAELVPLSDPYRRTPGAPFQVRALVDGKPVASQVVLYGGRTVGGKRFVQRQVRTDAQGLVQLSLDQKGTWYVMFISMRSLTPEAKDGVNYESKWATLTFAVQ